MPHFNTVPLKSSNAHDDAFVAGNGNAAIDVEKASVKHDRTLIDQLC